MKSNKKSNFILPILLFFIVFPLFSQQVPGVEGLDFDRVQADAAFRDGVLFLHSGRINDSIVAFQRVLSFKPDDILARLWLGRAYFFGGYEEAADEEWNQVVDAGGGSPALQSFMTTLSSRRGFGQEIREDQELFPIAAYSLTLPGSTGDIRIGSQVTQNEMPIGSRSMPGMIAKRSDGLVYIANFSQNSIQLYDSNGRLRQTFGGGIGGFAGPLGIVILPDNSLAVTSFRSDQVHIIDGTTGAFLRSFGKKGILPGEFLGPQHITYDPEGYLYITDYGNQRIQKWTIDGEFVSSFGNEEMFDRIAGIHWFENGLYVLNNRPESGQILFFDGFGNVLTEFESPQLRNSENFFSSHNEFYIVTRNSIFTFFPGQNVLQMVFSVPGQGEHGFIDLQIDANGNFLLSDALKREILVLSRLSGLYSGLHVQVNRVIADNFPRVRVEVSVEDRLGTGVLGIDLINFRLFEGGVPIQNPTMVSRGYQVNSMSSQIIVLPNQSVSQNSYKTALVDILQETWISLPLQDQIQIILAGSVPQYIRTTRGTNTNARELVDTLRYDPNWALDLGIRLAGNTLIQQDEIRNIIVIGDGRMNEASFKQFGLEETRAYMKNNGIRFNYVNIGSGSVDPIFIYLVEQTQGILHNYYEDSFSDILVELRTQFPARYWLEFTSQFDGDFGRRYLPVEVEVQHLTKSGRDEAGYFPPISF